MPRYLPPPEPPPEVLFTEPTPIARTFVANPDLRTSVVNDNVNPGVYLTLFLSHSYRCESGGVVQTCMYNPQQQQEKEENETEEQTRTERATNRAKLHEDNEKLHHSSS